MKKKATHQKRVTKRSATKTTRSASRKKNVDPQKKYQLIEEKAYELFERRGHEHGRDQDDWYEAERIVMTGGARVEQ